MQTINVPLSIQFGLNEAGINNSQLLLNAYAVQNVPGENEEYSIRQRWGITEIADTGEEIRGLYIFNNLLYALGETALRRYDLNGVPSTTTATTTASGERYEALDDGTNIAWLANTGTYKVLSGGGVFSSPAFPAGFTSTNFTYKDGYFIFDRSGTTQFFISALLDPTTFSALDFGSASEDSDLITRVFSANDQLWLLGQRSVEVFQNTGNADFPFEQIQGANNTTIGCPAEFSAIKAYNSIIFLGSDGNIYQSNGYSLVPISTPPVYERIAEMSDISDARGYIHPERGDWWYTITFPTGDLTFTCNLRTKQWHRRNTINNNVWSADYIRHANDQRTFCAIGNKIYQIDPAAYDDAGTEMERIWTTAVIEENDKNIIHHEIQPQITTGTVPLAESQTPVVEISYTDDGGFTYSTARSVSLQANAVYGRKVASRGLGNSKRRHYRFRVTDDLEISCIGCRARLEVEERE
jgi:hypothetical protein